MLEPGGERVGRADSVYLPNTTPDIVPDEAALPLTSGSPTFVPSPESTAPAPPKPGIWASRFAFVRDKLVGFQGGKVQKAERQIQAAKIEKALAKEEKSLAKYQLEYATFKGADEKKVELKNKINFTILVIDMLRDKQKLNTERPSPSVQFHFNKTREAAAELATRSALVYNTDTENVLGALHVPFSATLENKPQRSWSKLIPSPRDKIVANYLADRETQVKPGKAGSLRKAVKSRKADFKKVSDRAEMQIKKANAVIPKALEAERGAHLDFLIAVASSSKVLDTEKQQLWLNVLLDTKKATRIMQEKALIIQKKREVDEGKGQDPAKSEQLGQEIETLAAELREVTSRLSQDSLQSLMSSDPVLMAYMETTKAHILFVKGKAWGEDPDPKIIHEAIQAEKSPPKTGESQIYQPWISA